MVLWGTETHKIIIGNENNIVVNSLENSEGKGGYRGNMLVVVTLTGSEAVDVVKSWFFNGLDIFVASNSFTHAAETTRRS